MTLAAKLAVVVVAIQSPVDPRDQARGGRGCSERVILTAELAWAASNVECKEAR